MSFPNDLVPPNIAERGKNQCRIALETAKRPRDEIASAIDSNTAAIEAEALARWNTLWAARLGGDTPAAILRAWRESLRAWAVENL